MLPDALFWKVHMYGIMVALGVLAAFGVLYLYNKKMKIDLSFTDFLFYDGIVSVLLGFGCAALFQGVYNYIENPAAGFSLKGGITFLGGMLGGAAVDSFLRITCPTSSSSPWPPPCSSASTSFCVAVSRGGWSARSMASRHSRCFPAAF